MGKKKVTRKARAEEQADVSEHEYRETAEDRWEARMRQAADAEKASWAVGGNIINEGGRLCNLDDESIEDLCWKLTNHPEYEQGNRRGKPREKLVAVLDRKRRERDGGLGPEALQKQVAAMSAKKYVSHLLREAKSLDAAYEAGFKKEQVMGALDRMNRDVAVIKTGNAVKYLVRGVDATGREEYRFLSCNDFKQLYANVLVPRLAANDAGLVPMRGGDVKLSALWDSWDKRRELEGIGFFPGSEKHKPRVPHGYLNMWSGLSIEPNKGDWSLFRKHLRNKVCGGNDQYFAFMMDWLAHAVQKPQEKPGCAIVLKSTQKGSGKSMLLKFLRKIFGRHLYSAAKPDQLTGRFNGHLEETLIFGVEEGFWAGSHSANSALKDLITGEHIAVERKGLDSKNAPNFTRFIFLSNENWVVPAGTDERRYFVLDFEHDRAKDQTYFDPIFKQMEEEDGIEAMLHDLMEREIKCNLRNPPVTKGLLDQRVHGLDGCDRFILDLAKDSEIVAQMSGNKVSLHRHKQSIVGKSVVWEVARQYADRYETRSLQTSLGMRLSALGVKVIETRGGEHRRSFEFPRLPEFQRRVAALLGVPIDINDDGLEFDHFSQKLMKVVKTDEHPVH